MDEKLTKSLELILKWAEQSGDFVKEQTPLLIQETINYYTIYYLITFLLSLFIINISGYKLMKETNKVSTWVYDSFNDAFPLKFLSRLLLYISWVLFNLLTFSALTSFLKITLLHAYLL